MQDAPNPRPSAAGGAQPPGSSEETYGAGSALCDSLFCAIHVNADSTSASSLAVNPSIRTPVASAFFLASSAAATVCTHTRPRRTLAVNFCCFSSVIGRLLGIVWTWVRHDTRLGVR